MTTVTKVWGTTEPLVLTPMFELHRLCIKAGHRCSLHTHRFKHNAFYVISGKLFIDEYLDGLAGAPLITHTLWHHRTLTLPPGGAHQFRTGGVPCVALEMYYTEPLSEDIIRHNVGGSV